MNPSQHPRFEELVSALLDGALDDGARGGLMRLVESDPALLEELAVHLEVSEALSQQQPLRRGEVVVPALQDHIRAVASEPEDAFIHGLFRRIRRRRAMRITAWAAVIAALLAPIAWFGSQVWQEPDPAPVIARAIRLNDAGATGDPEEIRAGGTINLRDGVMRLNFTNGAVVAVESPASFTVHSAKLMHLHSGKLNAWCPESAHGFQVTTDDTTLTDLGTSFGIEAGPGGASDFVVMEGSVSVSKGAENRIIREGAAVSSSQDGGLRESPFETSSFQRTWALTSGIIATTGAVVPAKPDTPERLARIHNDSEVMVVPEGRDLPFDVPIHAEVSQPGHLEITTTPVPSHVVAPAPELRLNSYLVRVDPESDLQGPEHIHFEGSVTFDRPVVAIILGKKTLEASDERFANGKWPRPAGKPNTYHRGLEINWNTTIHDQVALSDDRRTVTIAFHTGVSTDDIRVITAGR